MKKKNLLLAFLILALALTAALLRLGDKAEHKVVSKKTSAPAKVKGAGTGDQSSTYPLSTTNHDAEPTSAAQLVKFDGNGSRIYQVDDTQVSVSRDGELFFLPSTI